MHVAACDAALSQLAMQHGMRAVQRTVEVQAG